MTGRAASGLRHHPVRVVLYGAPGCSLCDRARATPGRTAIEYLGAATTYAELDGRFSSSVIDIRAMPGLLHLKTGLSWLGGRRLLAVGEIARHEALSRWDVVRVPDGEDYAANCVSVNDALLVAEGFPATSALLDGLGYALVPLAMSEYRKMDGGLSCLSVRW